MIKLTLNEFYTREEVHTIFSPSTTFTPQAGSWGLQGIVKIPNRINDFVFFVTYGASQGDHDFEEGITSEGVLSWQSQPRQSFKSEVIQSLINHDETINSIHLFLRKEKKEPYEYLGRLKYINHDNERENPVWFQWQLIDFKSDEITTPEKEQNYDGIEKIGSLLFSDDKPLSKKAGVTQQSFKAKKAPDYARKDSQNRALGLEGEELVIKYEQKYLNDMNRADLAEKIIHVSKVEGDEAGYDLRSYDKNGEVKYIEVKTTRGNINTDFYMSPREIAFSQINEKNYYLYRVYDLKKQTNNGKFYIIKGDIEAHFNKTPTGFRLSKK